MAWHGDPALLKRDAYSGDYGIGMYGYWRSAGAYLGCAPPHGWLCVFCQIQPAQGDSSSSSSSSAAAAASSAAASSAAAAADCSGAVAGAVQDPFGRRVYVAPLGLSASVEGATGRHT